MKKKSYRDYNVNSAKFGRPGQNIDNYALYGLYWKHQGIEIIIQQSARKHQGSEKVANMAITKSILKLET